MSQDSQGLASSFNNLTTAQKVALVGALAVSGLGAAYFLSGKGGIDGSKGNKKKNGPLSSKSVENDPNAKQAAELKEEGNKAFKNGKYEDAVEFYARALKLSDVDSHLLYSNRSAAYVALGNFDAAIGDAKKCIELKPEWSKGYFRLGKAQLAMNDVNDAFINFYRGCVLEPKSEELKKFLETARSKLPPFGKRATKFINQAKLINLYMEKIAADFLSELGITFEQLKSVLEKAVRSKEVGSILKTNPLLQECVTKNESAINAAISLILLVTLEQQELALPFARRAHEVDSDNPNVLIVLSLVLIRQTKYSFRSWDEAVEILNMIKDALILKPDDLFIAHTYMGFVATLVPSVGQQDCPIDIGSLLQELRMCLGNPQTDKLQIAHTGIQIWFKYFEDPALQQRLMDEEQQTEKRRLSHDQAYLEGILHGSFHALCMDPFFLHALSESILPFPQLERILCPFRSAITTLSTDKTNDFKELEPLLYGIATQSWKNNYVWEVKAVEKVRIEKFIQETNELLQDVGKVVVDGTIPHNILHNLSMISMYSPLTVVKNIESLILLLDLSKLHPIFVSLINKSILRIGAEQDIEETLQPLVPIPEADLVKYNNEHLGSVWDTPPNPSLVQVSIAEELKWRFPYYTPRGFTNEKTRILIAGCGTGKEIHSIVSTYSNVVVSAIDYSSKRLAYAIRQNKELGIDNVTYHYGDIMSVTTTHFEEKLFDVVVANDLLHFMPDPLKGWERLARLLRPGGIMHITLHNKRAVSTLKEIRQFLSSKINPPVFDNADVPKLIRIPSDDEVRDARRILFESLEAGANLPSLTELISTLSFYTLNDFRELIFHPVVYGFTYTTVLECINKLGMKLVGFEFPEILNEKELSYRGENPSDPDMLNGALLDKFDQSDPQAFSGFYITFTCEKK